MHEIRFARLNPRFRFSFRNPDNMYEEVLNPLLDVVLKSLAV